MISRKCQGHWWASRTSNPVWGAKTVPGGFDSHALPPISKDIFCNKKRPQTSRLQPLNELVPEVGIEPTLSRGKGDFESPASTSFTTPAWRGLYKRGLKCQEKCIDKISDRMLMVSSRLTEVNGHGVVAQLGERLNGIQEARGSTPLSSTSISQGLRSPSGHNPLFFAVSNKQLRRISNWLRDRRRLRGNCLKPPAGCCRQGRCILCVSWMPW